MPLQHRFAKNFNGYLMFLTLAILFFGIVDCSNIKERVSCSYYEFACRNGPSCISKGFLCNGAKDCYDGSDESGCEYINKCNSRPCQQTCENTTGSFKCLCAEGYVMKEDTTSCRLLGDYPIIIISNYKEITVDVLGRSRSYGFAHKSNNTILSTAFHEETSEIFLLETFVNGGYVRSMNTNGSSGNSFQLNEDFKNPESLAIDWMTSMLYITDHGEGIIAACTFNGKNCTNVIRDPDFSPVSITLDVLHGEMYWSDWGKTPGIYRSGMDGSSIKLIVANNITRPLSLVFDQLIREIFWCDLDYDFIYYVSLVDKNVREVKVRFGPIQSFAKIEDWLYYASRVDSIYRYGIRSKVSELVVQTKKQVFNIEIFHPSLNPKSFVVNPCAENICSQLCLLAPNASHSCACSKGFKLNSDKLSCTKIESNKGIRTPKESEIVTNSTIISDVIFPEDSKKKLPALNGEED